jgi:nucleoid DNA-binding protein
MATATPRTKTATPKGGTKTTTAPTPTARAAAQPPSQAEIVRRLAERTGLRTQQVKGVIEGIGEEIRAELAGKKGSGTFRLGSLVKFRVVRKPASKARQGISPFTKQPTTIAARPAHNVIKVAALKTLKDMLA